MKAKDKIVSLPRAFSKLGVCSRTQAVNFILAGRVKVNSTLCTDPARRVNLSKDRIELDNKPIKPEQFVYIALNKQRGLITTFRDEKNRETVYKCFEGFNLPYVFPVGRLDKASEGLILFTNDTNWANKILDPENHLKKTYHVQINRLADEELISKIENGVVDSDGEILKVVLVKMIRAGKKNSWLEIVLEQGKNRHIRRIFETLGIEVLRLVRIQIGNIKLGNLPKGEFRFLSEEEVRGISE